MWTYNQTEQCELYHYGVVGMKWGVHRSLYKSSANDRLMRKAVKWDKKAAKLTKKSEKIHAVEDLEGANKKAVKAAKYDAKAAKFKKKSLNTTNESDKLYYEKKSEKLKYKAAANRIEGNTISKSKGYSARAMKYSIKSDMVAKKAAKARMKIANNKYYIDRMKRKVSEISKEDLAGAYAFVNRLKTN